MITKKTVFVVGAGGSAPYGLPTGYQLKSLITGQAVREALVTAAAYGGLAGTELLDDLVGALADSPLSVDALLEHRPALLNVGKAAIAAALLPLEHRGAGPAASGDWLSYLIPRMTTVQEDFPKNEVAFVTFNYDRLIEERLTRALTAQYGIDTMAAWAFVEQIPIVHVYGQIGKYSPPGVNAGVQVYDYQSARPDAIASRIRYGAAGINLIHDRVTDSSALQQARELIGGSDRVFFLGFGFDETNMSRLGIPMNAPMKESRIVCSTFGMSTGERVLARQAVSREFGLDPKSEIEPEYWSNRSLPVVLADPRLDALDTLREYADLLV